MKSANILGVKVKMKCGLSATCIAYRNCKDIDIQFDDGIIKEHVCKSNFEKGLVSHPNISISKEKSSCVGLTKMMNCGLEATCIRYRNSKDIDIQFEDGIIVEHKRKDCFLNGTIHHPNFPHNTSLINKANCIGITIMQNCGMNATCIEYRGSHDIDVKFEDGTIVKNKAKYSFIDGMIENPNIASFSFPQKMIWYVIKKYFSDAIWNYRPYWLKNPTTNLPLEIDIWIPSLKSGVEYDGYEFHKEENYLSSLKSELIMNNDEILHIYTFLEKGAIEHNSSKHINLYLNHKSSRKEYKNLVEGLKQQILILLKLLGIEEEYIFDEDFTKNVIKSKITTNKEVDFFPETHIMNNGQSASIISYRGSKDIDILFEDGTVVLHKSIANFRKGKVTNPNYNRANCIGKEIKQHCGMNATCIAYRNSNDIDVIFTDGTIVYNKRKGDFYKGTIKNPSLVANTLGKGFIKDYIGTCVIQKNGLKATCINYNSAIDIDVQFEDGTIVKHTRKYSFEKGLIKNPNLFAKKMIGMTKKMNCGLYAEIIEYKNANDMTIRFEDGTIIKKVFKGNFDKGEVAHSNADKYESRKKSCLGKSVYQKCGMVATCIEYHRNDDITVEFTNGTIVNHVKKDTFLNGKLYILRK